MKRLRMIVLGSLAIVGFLLVAPAGPAFAAETTRYVTEIHDGAPAPGDPEQETEWYRAESTAGGTVELTEEWGGAPGFGNDALALSTDSSSTAKAQAVHFGAGGTSLDAVTELSYYTYQPSDEGNPSSADAAFNLAIFATPGGGGSQGNGFTTLVFEPYQGSEDPITPDTWQLWDVDQGLLWSTEEFTCGTTTFPGTNGGPATITLAEVQAACNAVVISYGANIGSGAPNLTVGVDGIVFGTATDTVRNDFGPK